MQFDLQIEEVSLSQRILHFTLSHSIISDELDKAYADVQKNIRMKGYRRGKAPRWLLEKKYASGIEPEVAEKLIDSSYKDADKPFRVVGQASLVEKVERLPRNEDFKFSIRIDIFPEVESVNYLNLEIPYESKEVNEDEVQQAIDARVNSKASFNELTEGTLIGASDFALVSLKLSDGDEVVREEASTMLNASNERFYPGVGELLIGMTINETKTAEVTIDDSSAFEDLKGKSLTAEITVQSGQAQTVPELSDELAVELGYEDVGQMKVAITDEIQQRQETSAKEAARIQILQKLVEVNEVEVPQGLIVEQYRNLVEEMTMRRAYMTGKNPKEITFTDAEQSDFENRAGFAAKASILIAGVAKAESLAAEDADIDAKINEIATARGETDTAIRAYIESENAMDVLKERIIEEKTLDWLFEHSNLVAPESIATPSDEEAPSEADAVEKSED
jgi:trigger factor